MKKTLVFSTLMMGSMASHAAMQQMNDAEMSEVHGHLQRRRCERSKHFWRTQPGFQG